MEQWRVVFYCLTLLSMRVELLCWTGEWSKRRPVDRFMDSFDLWHSYLYHLTVILQAAKAIRTGPYD